MLIEKSHIITALKSRGLDSRAEFVDRQLPDLVDTHTNAALLQMLGIDPADLTPADVTPADLTPAPVTPQ